jgi:putative transposase
MFCSIKVRAGLVKRAQDWKWSIADAHIADRDDCLVNVALLAKRYEDIASLLESESQEAEKFQMLRSAETIGRPLGSDKWLRNLRNKQEECYDHKSGDRRVKPGDN